MPKLKIPKNAFTLNGKLTYIDGNKAHFSFIGAYESDDPDSFYDESRQKLRMIFRGADGNKPFDDNEFVAKFNFDSKHLEEYLGKYVVILVTKKWYRFQGNVKKEKGQFAGFLNGLDSDNNSNYICGHLLMLKNIAYYNKE